MELELKNGQKEIVMKECILRVKNMEKDQLNLLMVLNMMGNFRIMILKDKEQ